MRQPMIFAAVIGLSLAACGGSDSPWMSGSGGGGGSGGAATSTGSGTSSSTGGDGGGSAANISCGGTADEPCPGDMYCDYPDDNCGKDVQTGTCQLRMDVCGESPPVCGCDGEFYRDICVLQNQGQDLGTGCEPPADHFACGTLFCVNDTELCSIVDLEGNMIYHCEPRSAACAKDDFCACTDWNPRTTCEQDPISGQVTLRTEMDALE